VNNSAAASALPRRNCPVNARTPTPISSRSRVLSLPTDRASATDRPVSPEPCFIGPFLISCGQCSASAGICRPHPWHIASFDKVRSAILRGPPRTSHCACARGSVNNPPEERPGLLAAELDPRICLRPSRACPERFGGVFVITDRLARFAAVRSSSDRSPRAETEKSTQLPGPDPFAQRAMPAPRRPGPVYRAHRTRPPRQRVRRNGRP